MVYSILQVFPIAHHSINGYTTSMPPMALTLHNIQPLQYARISTETQENPWILFENQKTHGSFINHFLIIIYNKLILQWKRLFSSDQALLRTPKTKDMVNNFASSTIRFFQGFFQFYDQDEQPYRRARRLERVAGQLTD